jgi:hypothetical protein
MYELSFQLDPTGPQLDPTGPYRRYSTLPNRSVKKVLRRFSSVALQGFIPAFVRLGPQTILTFVFLEQLRLRFGDQVPA